MLTDFARDGLFSAMWFGLIAVVRFDAFVAAELVAPGAGCWALHRRGANRWFAWSVALVVAAHFIPLAFLMEDFSLAAVGGLLLVGLVLLKPRLRSITGTSTLVGMPMGSGLLTASLIAGLAHSSADAATRSWRHFLPQTLAATLGG